MSFTLVLFGLFRCEQPCVVFYVVLLLGVLCFCVLVPFVRFSGLIFTLVRSDMWVYSAVRCAVCCIMLWDDNCGIRYNFVYAIFCYLLHWELMSAGIYY